MCLYISDKLQYSFNSFFLETFKFVLWNIYNILKKTNFTFSPTTLQAYYFNHFQCCIK